MIAAHSFFLQPVERRRTGLLATLVASVALLAASSGSAARPTPAELTELARAALPAGCTLTPAAATGLPPGWQSADTSGVVLQISDGRQTRTVCLVPLDWVGTQTRKGQVDLVRRGPTAKVILTAGAAEQFPWLDTFAPDQASLAAPGSSTDAYAGQYPRVDAEVRTILRKSSVSRDLTVASFIALGVPAEDLIRDVALDTRSSARLDAVRALRHFPGKDTLTALLKIVADRGRDAAAERCRLAALDACDALMLESHGPALVSALQATRDDAVIVRVASEINRLRYVPAAAELRRVLKASQSPVSKIACARALATLRDPAAAAEIRAAMQAPAPKRAAVSAPTDAALRRSLGLELHRLDGAWGPETRGRRLSVVVESPGRVCLYVENMGADPMRYIPYPTDATWSWPVGLQITLDDVRISPPGPRDADLGLASATAREIDPGSAMCFELELATPVAPDGEHIVTADWFGIVANAVTVRSGAVAAQAQPAS